MRARASALRIALFGTPSRFSLFALRELAADRPVAALVLSQPQQRGLRASLASIAGVRRMSPVEAAAREHRFPVIFSTPSNQSTIAEQLRAVRPDLICVATFPRLIPPEIIAMAPLGAINVHPSLLPRHRGPLPLFWTYHADDRASGVTVHHLDGSFDSGDIILQEAFPLPRAYPVAKLDGDVAHRGASLLRAAVEALAGGRAARTAQDERAATYAPRIRPGTPMVRFEEWDVERIWHFLAGLSSQYREPLIDDAGRSAQYQAVVGFERGPAGTAGTVESVANGWRINCCGGVVLLAKAS
jgi:methionyl-tRNA formyltransferase